MSEITTSHVSGVLRVGDSVRVPGLAYLFRPKWWQLRKRWRRWRMPDTFNITKVSTFSITIDDDES